MFKSLPSARKCGHLNNSHLYPQILHDSKHRGIEVGDVKLNHSGLPVIDSKGNQHEHDVKTFMDEHHHVSTAFKLMSLLDLNLWNMYGTAWAPPFYPGMNMYQQQVKNPLPLPG
ncbi:hypothetical protein QR685DRAFT_557424 [Neurospora intermedia]|uniref:Uncharacterized protein n=1 Tax=Neurospora intermedia TaxID=5142 RepID=A0ABR3CZX8_NEUIN